MHQSGNGGNGNDTILGYYANGNPIHPIPPGSIATCACIFCKECKVMIRSAGGPAHDSLCPRCFEQNRKYTHDFCTGCYQCGFTEE